MNNLPHYDGYAFIDTETTGLKPDLHGIVEIGYIRTDRQFKIEEYWRTLVKPAAKVIWTPEAVGVHGITQERVANAPSEQTVADTFRSLIKDRGILRIAGFNIEYDLGMLEGLKQRTGGEPWGLGAENLPPLCLLEEAREKLPNLPKVWNPKWEKYQTHTLELVAKHLEIRVHGAHGAAADIYATLEMARVLVK